MCGGDRTTICFIYCYISPNSLSISRCPIFLQFVFYLSDYNDEYTENAKYEDVANVTRERQKIKEKILKRRRGLLGKRT